MRTAVIRSTPLAACALAAVVFLASCAGPSSATADEPPAEALPKPAVDLPPGKPGELRTAVLAGGCFWCEQAVFEQLDGVTQVVSGYAGGTPQTATYEKYHDSNHAEAFKVTYDPSVVSYGGLLRVLFTAGDPTTKDGQEPDYGHQYRMAVFYENDDQQRVAEAYIKQLNDAGAFKAPIAASVEPMPSGFFPAEDYHQHFVTKNPNHPYVRQWSLPKIAKVRAAFPDQVKPADQTPPNK